MVCSQRAEIGVLLSEWRKGWGLAGGGTDVRSYWPRVERER